jgi:DNA-binding NarL/FixJ family response regulator
MIRILLVDDQAIIRQALQALLEREQDFEIVGTADNGQTAIEQTEALKPDLLLCDIEMPGMSGIAATRVICRRLPKTKVIVLSSYADEAHLAAAIRAGAQGYLLKNTLAEDLVSTIRSVHRGYSQLGPGLFEKIVARVSDHRHDKKPFSLEVAKVGLSETKLLLLLDHFDVDVLFKLLKDAIAQDVVDPLLAYLNHYLEEHPVSLAALYLCGILSFENKDQESALLYLRFGFNEGIRQKLPCEDLLLFYQGAIELQPESTFSWLTQTDSPWMSEEGLVFLLSEAQNRFGEDSIPHRTLLALRQIRTLNRLSKACLSLNSNLKVLQGSFDRLHSAVTL